MLRDSQDFYTQRVGGSWVVPYMKGRGLGWAAGTCGVGLAPKGWRTTTQHLLRLGHSEEAIIGSGVGFRSSKTGDVLDALRNRLTVPIHDARGDIIAFTGRATSADERAGSPKYLNTRTTDLFHKKDVLFGLNEQRNALTKGATPVIVEGVMDTMAIRQAQWETKAQNMCAVAPLGTALTERHVAELIDVVGQDRTIVAAFDPDTAGQKAGARAWQLMREYGNEVRSIALPTGADPAALVERGESSELSAALADAPPLWQQIVRQDMADLGAPEDAVQAVVHARHVLDKHADFIPQRDSYAFTMTIARQYDLVDSAFLWEASQRLSERPDRRTMAASSEAARPPRPAQPLQGIESGRGGSRFDAELAAARQSRTAGFGSSPGLGSNIGRPPTVNMSASRNVQGDREQAR